MLEFFLSDDATPLTEAAIANFVAGATSDALRFHVWHERDNPAGEDLLDLALAIYTEDPGQAGSFVRQGATPQDELWCEVRAIGQNNAADTTQQDFVTGWLTLGAYRVLPFPSLHAGCSRHFEIRFRPPSTSPPNFWRFQLSVIHSEHALPVPFSELEAGIVTGIGDRRQSHLVRGGVVSVSAPADDLVQVAALQAVIAGELVGLAGIPAIQLDQADSAAEALAAGESYWAALTVGAGGVVATKGARAPEPEKPALPAGELLLQYVRVEYQAGGVSVIEADDLEGEIVYGRHRVLPGVGLEARVHPGFAIGGGTWRYWSRVESLPLAPNQTTFVWQRANGLYELTGDEVPPDDSSLGPLAEVDTDGAAITEIRDRRTYAGRARILTLRGNPGPAAGVLQSMVVGDARLFVERVILRASDNPGTAGATIVDITRTRGGVTESLYTSSGVEDQRPSLAFDDAGLIHDSGIPEIVELRTGDVVALETVQHATGGAAVEIEVNLLARNF